MLNWDMNKEILNKANYKKIETTQAYKDTFGELQTFIVYTTLVNNKWDKVDEDFVYINFK